MNKHFALSAVCLAIAGAVVLSSAHSAQVVSAAQLDKPGVSDATVKIHTELHNHVDKAGKVINDMSQIDARSLRLRDHKRHLKVGPIGRLLGSWRDYLS